MLSNTDYDEALGTVSFNGKHGASLFTHDSPPMRIADHFFSSLDVERLPWFRLLRFSDFYRAL
jgi:hypothetical protein